ncbi:MAG TPA: phosphate/phosphite/phosphonate ABC transporter substrate-binding protein [Armatimonadetes bacterium]|nr:phosphate/phosphite/phosphonate ABC transporter substrate-binding protein [Armatimonadota bacterium]
MHSRMSMYMLTISLLSALVFTGCGKHKLVHKLSVKLAFEPSYSLHVMASKYIDLINYLSEATGYRIEWISSTTHEGLIAAIEKGKADIAFVEPFHYVILRKTCGAVPFLKVLRRTSDGGASASDAGMSRGLIIAHRNGATPSLQDIADNLVMVPSRQSLFGYAAQLALCQQRDIDLKSLRIVIGRRHDQVAIAVARGRVRFGFVREGALDEIADVINRERVAVIAKTEPFPNSCFVYFPETERNRPQVLAKLKRALLALNEPTPEHKRILQQAGWSGFVEVSDEEYAPVRHVLMRLNLPY